MQARAEPSTRTDGFVHRSLKAMGCRFELMLDPAGSPHDRYATEAIADELIELIQDWHDRLSLFSCGSIVSMINRSLPNERVRVDREMFELLRLCDCLCNETDGAFNIAAGTLMHAHGFRSDSPSVEDLDCIDLRKAISLDADALTITRSHSCVQIDLGAIAKGYVLDLIRDELRSYEIKRGFVHGGSSSVLAHGAGWQVAIGDDADLVASLSSTSLSVSAHDGRLNDRGEGHIMDPNSGKPARERFASIACAHPSAAIADAYTTALGVTPKLIDQLHEHGCSIAMIPHACEIQHIEPIVRDRVGVFTERAAQTEASKTVQGLKI